MNSFWKGVSLTIIILLGFILAYNLFSGGSKSSGIDKTAYNQQVDTYHQYLEKQDKRNSQYFEKMNEEIIKIKKINEKSLKSAERFERLIERWEKQADRFDKILSQMENKI